MEFNRNLLPNLFITRNCTQPSPEWWIPIIPSSVIFLIGILVILSIRGIFFIFNWLYRTHNVHGSYPKSSNNFFQSTNSTQPGSSTLKQINTDSNGRKFHEIEHCVSGEALALDPLDSVTNPLVGPEQQDRQVQQNESGHGVVMERLVLERVVLERNRHTFLSELERLSQRIHYSAVDMLFARTRSGTVLVSGFCLNFCDFIPFIYILLLYYFHSNS